jgi:hypothetical protein
MSVVDQLRYTKSPKLTNSSVRPRLSSASSGDFTNFVNLLGFQLMKLVNGFDVEQKMPITDPVVK